MRYKITPVPKPRQTRSDKWKQRPCVMRYRAFSDEINAMDAKLYNGDSIAFTMPMPKSWSKKKKAEMNQQPHQQVPDLDNLLKALMDAIHKQDCALWHLSCCMKVWGYEGAIEIEQN